MPLLGLRTRRTDWSRHSAGAATGWGSRSSNRRTIETKVVPLERSRSAGFWAALWPAVVHRDLVTFSGGTGSGHRLGHAQIRTGLDRRGCSAIVVGRRDVCRGR